MSFRNSSAYATDCVNNLTGQSRVSSRVEDRRLTPCTVDLYVRPVEGSDIAEHWVLYFQWQHYHESYEANQNEKGILVPRAYDGEPEEIENLRYSRKIRIANALRVYPEAVRKLAKNNIFSYKKYDILTCNCQNWIRELGRQLQLKLPDSQVAEEADRLATAGIATAAVFGGFAYIAKSLSKN